MFDCYYTFSQVKKEGCKWILVSHDPVDSESAWKAITDGDGCSREGMVVLKFEPFILHAQCRSLPVAKWLHTLGLESGFKNSGLTVGKNGKLVQAVRSAHGLEAPLTDREGRMLASREHFDFLVSLANEKLASNEERHRKLLAKLKEEASPR